MNMIIQAAPEPIEIDTSKSAVIVVDMQNAFVRQGGYFDILGYDITTTQRIIKPCREIVETARKKGIKIIYLQMAYSENLSDIGGIDSPARRKSRLFALIDNHPELIEKLHVYGKWGAAIIEELEPQQGDIIIRKQKHDGFIGTNLDIILRTLGIRYLIFIGTATNICVESTLRHAFSLEYFSILISDAVSQLGMSLTQEAAILNVQSTFGWTTTSEKVLNAIQDLENHQSENL